MKKLLVLTFVLCLSIFTWQQITTACPMEGHNCQKKEAAKQLGEGTGQQVNAKPDCDHPCDGLKSGDKQAQAKSGCDHPCNAHKDGDNPYPNKKLCDRKI